MSIDTASNVAHAGSPKRGEPTWDVAHFYPAQGDWTVDAYFDVFQNRGYEYVDGFVERLPMPTKEHQRLAKWLLYRLDEYLQERGGGETFMMGYRTHTVPERYREPDVMYVSNDTPSTNRNAESADLVIEVVSDSPGDRKRDLVIKREEYEAAGIPEYWIVDAAEQRIRVLVLDGDRYAETIFEPGQRAASRLLEGFEVDVAACFAAAGS